MTDETRCAGPTTLEHAPHGMIRVTCAICGFIGPWFNRSPAPHRTPPATVATLVEALENLMDVQTFATGWDNGVTDATGTMNEGGHWHGLAMNRARAALALYRGEAGR